MKLPAVVLFFLLLVPGLAVAADLSQLGSSGEPVELEADSLSYDRSSGEYRAAGDVHLRQGEFEVTGEELHWNQQSGELNADGGVTLSSPEDTLSGSRARYNLQSNTGMVEDGYFFLHAENLHVRGTAIERRGESQFHIEAGVFTTCNGDSPSWKFGASQLDVTLGGYARAKNAVFYLKDIPVFYFPYLVYPVKTERESGLLIPSFSYSSTKGVGFSQAYYQVIADNQDATLYLDYLSEAGVGKGLEYRYIFGLDNAGEAQIYHIDVNRIDGDTIDEERYAMSLTHNGTLPGEVRLRADLEYVNDNDYFSDFGELADEYNKDEVQSDLSLQKNWGKFSLLGALRYTEDLETDDDTTLQLLPRITLEGGRQRIADSFLFYSLFSEYSHFWREEGQTGQRMMVRPALSTTLPFGGVASLTPELAYRQRYYWDISGDDDTREVGLPEVRVSLNSRVQRTFETDSAALSRLRHVIEPELVYSYIGDEDQSEIPVFDSYDQIDEENQLEYALIQRFKGRFERDGQSEYRDLAYLRTSLIEDLDSENDSILNGFRNELRLTPFDGLSFAADATLDLDNGDWEEIGAETDIVVQQNNSLRLRYQRNLDESLDYGRLDLSVGILAPIYLYYQQRYDFVDDEVVEEVVALEYRQQCWSLFLTYRDHDDSQSLMVNFSLSGLSTSGR